MQDSKGDYHKPAESHTTFILQYTLHNLGWKPRLYRYSGEDEGVWVYS